jgi:hypothetical protein
VPQTIEVIDCSRTPSLNIFEYSLRYSIIIYIAHPSPQTPLTSRPSQATHPPLPTTNRFPSRTRNPHNRARLRRLMDRRRHLMGEHRFAADLVRHRAWTRIACWRQRRMVPRLIISLVLLQVLLVIIILTILLTSMWRISSTLVLCRIHLRVLVVTRRLRLRARLELGS